MKRLGLIIPMAFLVLVLSAVGCGRNVASAPDVDATVAAAVAAAAVSHQTDAPVACQRHWGLHPVAVVTLSKPRSSNISMAFSWSAGRTCWSFLGLEPSGTATLGMAPLAMDARASTGGLSARLSVGNHLSDASMPANKRIFPETAGHCGKRTNLLR